MRTLIGVLILVGIASATWTSYRAWGQRTPAGRAEDTPGLALGRLDQRKHFTYSGWRYRSATAVIYIVTAGLALIWLWLGGP